MCGLLVELAFAHFPSSALFQHCDASAAFGQQCTIPGMFAIVGAAATLSGVTRTTVSLGIIVSELTGSIQYVVPVLLAVLVAKTVGEALEPMSIYVGCLSLRKPKNVLISHQIHAGSRSSQLKPALSRQQDRSHAQC